MIEGFLVGHWWAGPVVSFALLLSDYSLTIAGARRYRDVLSKHVTHEGSYELTPQHAAEVDALRPFSWAVVRAGLLLAALLAGLRFVEMQLYTFPSVYLVSLGIVILGQLVVHFRHARTLHMARVMASTRVEGHIHYPRTATLRVSAFEFLAFSVVFALVYGLTGDLMFLGGVLGSLGIAGKHFAMARAAVPRA